MEIDDHQSQNQIASAEWEEGLLESSSLVMGHTVDVLSQVDIRSSLGLERLVRLSSTITHALLTLLLGLSLLFGVGQT